MGRTSETRHKPHLLLATVLAVSQAKLGQLAWVAAWQSAEADVPRVKAQANVY